LAALKLGDVVIHRGPRRVRLPDTVAGGNASKFLQRTYVPFLVRIIKNNNALSLHFGSGRMIQERLFLPFGRRRKTSIRF
jgi:hypothetical protein